MFIIRLSFVYLSTREPSKSLLIVIFIFVVIFFCNKIRKFERSRIFVRKFSTIPKTNQKSKYKISVRFLYLVAKMFGIENESVARQFFQIIFISTKFFCQSKHDFRFLFLDKFHALFVGLSKIIAHRQFTTQNENCALIYFIRNRWNFAGFSWEFHKHSFVMIYQAKIQRNRRKREKKSSKKPTFLLRKNIFSKHNGISFEK